MVYCGRIQIQKVKHLQVHNILAIKIIWQILSNRTFARKPVSMKHNSLKFLQTKPIIQVEVLHSMYSAQSNGYNPINCRCT